MFPVQSAHGYHDGGSWAYAKQTGGEYAWSVYLQASRYRARGVSASPLGAALAIRAVFEVAPVEIEAEA